MGFSYQVGVDAIGMSTVHEVQVACHSGVTVLGLSLISNISVVSYDDVGTPANHEEVLEAGKNRANDMKKLVSKIVEKLEI